MPVQIFLSTVSDEFRDYRDHLRGDLTRHNVEVKVQEDFKDYGGVTLEKLDVYIDACDAVVHLVGNMTGSEANLASTSRIVAKYPDICDRLPPLREPLQQMLGISYTQWEAWLALYHGKILLIAKADETAPRGPRYAPTITSRAAQEAHLERLRSMERYPGSPFTSPDNLASQIAYTVILDLLAKDRGGGHRSALRDSLLDLGTMAFVDVMRLACVAASGMSRSINGARYVEFVDIADLHLNEFLIQVTRLDPYLDLDAARKCQEVERGLAWAIVRLRRGPHLDRTWREFAQILRNLALRVDDLAKCLHSEYYDKRVQEVAAVTEAATKPFDASIQGDADRFVERRFFAQSAVVDHLTENGLAIATIRDDIDRRLAIPYFTIDFALLREATGMPRD